jgi:hypothetical protein
MVTKRKKFGSRSKNKAIFPYENSLFLKVIMANGSLLNKKSVRNSSKIRQKSAKNPSKIWQTKKITFCDKIVNFCQFVIKCGLSTQSQSLSQNCLSQTGKN